MKINTVISAFFASILFFSCSQKEKPLTILVKNTLDQERSFETISLTKELLIVDSLTNLGVKDVATDKLLVTQLIDNDGDGIMDELIFQPLLSPKSEKKFEIISISEANRPESKDYCYSRFVPERTDDYAWENDRVAFRMFGPTAQKMVEDGVAGGTLSSGVDAWLKKVDYPIINNWYKKETETDGTYHEDTGEGLDDFHVGNSRGVGGLAIKKDSTYYFSKNYTRWRTITTGPIRTSFYLEIADWDASGNTIKESKIVSLDRGNNFSKFKVELEGSEEVYAGLTLHEKDGKVSGSKNKGWVSYWQPHGDSELGTGIIANSNYFKGFEIYNVEENDLNNAYAQLKVKNHKVIYYAGFGWKKRGRFNNQKEWENHLSQFADKLRSPMMVSVINTVR
ncbi:DUF4861 family protein [Maribacter sp. ACAM166]|uniref:DUF4861 family protein n=1 Tax=Maribacter sp. ACAM166 TaxID=2508996 RepID=UPI0010FF1D91|nr:DUF4861 family protein [Maribacter sp. ACAM166]TLP71973.1 DUF4861 domain-containing protein [Maribacter sp. ACAM166]